MPEEGTARPRSLVTGGAGFLGSHLCERLWAEGHEVLCLDNLITGSLENVQHLREDPRFLFVRHDVTEPIDLRALFMKAESSAGASLRRSVPLRYVLHLASPASPKDYAKNPIHTLKVGALGTYHALGLAKATGSVFLLASSSEVYGDPEVNPQPESYWGHVNPIGPRSVYDEAKRFAEALALAYHREHGVKVRVARIFNTYGARMRLDDGRALPQFMVQALQNNPLSVYGDGRQTRSLCHVADMVEGLFRLLHSDEVGPVNLGNPDEVCIRQLAEEVIEATGSRSRIEWAPLPADDPRQRRPDITRAKALLGWQPRISRQEGLRDVMGYFRAQLEALCLP